MYFFISILFLPLNHLWFVSGPLWWLDNVFATFCRNFISINIIHTDGQSLLATNVGRDVERVDAVVVFFLRDLQQKVLVSQDPVAAQIEFSFWSKSNPTTDRL